MQSNSHFERLILETFHGNLIYSQNFCQNTVERKSPKEILFFITRLYESTNYMRAEVLTTSSVLIGQYTLPNRKRPHFSLFTGIVSSLIW